MLDEKEQREAEWRKELEQEEEEHLDREAQKEIDEPESTAADHEAECQTLSREGNILGRVGDGLREMMFAGSTAVVKLIVLTIFTRHLVKPVSVAVRGESSAGKSYAIEMALRFVAPEAIYALTSMSEKALAYSEEEFVHRMIVLYEADALANKNTAYLVRCLLSEGRIVHEYTDFDGGRKTEKLVKDGPTGLILSSAGRIDYELGTRVFSVNIDDGPQATKAILLSLAQAAEGVGVEPDFAEFHALDRLIASGERRVVVPFAGRVAAACDASATRMRRDFRAVLGLVQAHALLHQTQRTRHRDGQIIAEMDDYAAVFELVADVLAYSSGQAIPAQIRETVEAVDHLQYQDGTAGDSVKIAEIAEYLGIHRSTVSRRIKGAIKLDLLHDLEGQRGGPRLIKIGEPLPEDRGVLPSPDDLRLRDSGDEGVS